MHKSQMFFLSASPRVVKMLERSVEKQTTTSKCFLLPTAAILEQKNKELWGFSADCENLYILMHSVFRARCIGV